MENSGLSIEMLNVEVCDTYVYGYRGYQIVTEASHRQLARITTACLTRNGVVSATRMP